MEKIKVLFLAANPNKTSILQLDEEIRAITQKIRASEYRDSLELVSIWAVRADDLLQSLNEHKPHIVHFSGHGNSEGEILLVDNNGIPKPIAQQALTALFTTLKDNIRVVVLNACYSQAQAQAITQVIDCAIGMNTAIGDHAAIIFAASFYRAIGFGRSVQEAFEQGRVSLMLEGIPEVKTPTLLVRNEVEPNRIVFINKPNIDQTDKSSPTKLSVTENFLMGANKVSISVPIISEADVSRNFLGYGSEVDIKSVQKDELGKFEAQRAGNPPQIGVEAPFTIMPAFAVVKFRIENKSPKKVTACYMKLNVTEVHINENGIMLHPYPEGLYPKKILWSGISIDGNLDLRPNAPEYLSVLELGQEHFRFLFQGEKSLKAGTREPEYFSDSQIEWLSHAYYAIELILFCDDVNNEPIRIENKFALSFNVTKQKVPSCQMVIKKIESYEDVPENIEAYFLNQSRFP